MTIAPVSGLTYDELCRWYPDEDGYRRELIDGELYVSPAPSTRHQTVVVSLAAALHAHATRHGGRSLVAPFEVWLGERDVPQPDVLYLAATHQDRLSVARLVGAPDLLVEVSSPSSRRTDLLVKRRLYEAHAVPHYWVVDLEQEAVIVHDLASGGYAEPRVVRGDEVLAAPTADGFTIAVDAVLVDG